MQRKSCHNYRHPAFAMLVLMPKASLPKYKQAYFRHDGIWLQAAQ